MTTTFASVRPSVRPSIPSRWRQKCRLKEQLVPSSFIDLGKAATKVALFCHQSEAKIKIKIVAGMFGDMY
jgi:hypothetical protein